MLWFSVLSLSHAADLGFETLSVSAEQGLTFVWALDAPSADTITKARAEGAPPPLVSIQVAADGVTRSVVLDLDRPSGVLTLDGGDWPPGLSATVRLERGPEFAGLRTAAAAGRTIDVPVSGGIAGAAAPTSVPPWRIDTGLASAAPPAATPVRVDLAFVDRADRTAKAQLDAAAEAERRRARQRQVEDAERQAQAYLARALGDPTHPVHAACAAGLTGDDVAACVRIGAFRLDGAAEVAACQGFGAPADRLRCVQGLVDRAYGSASAIGACVAGWGDGAEGLWCVEQTGSATDDPTEDLVACAAVEPESRRSCVSWFAGREGDDPRGVGACAALFQGEQLRECFAEIAYSHPQRIAAMNACAEVFPDDRIFACTKRVMDHDGDPAAVAACAAVPARKRLDCVGEP